MPSLRVSLPEPDASNVDWQRIRAELQLPNEFPQDVLEAAEAAAKSRPFPDLDLTATPFFTVDPPGSMDLDQAMHLERRGEGFRVSYAIADVVAFVEPGGIIDVEANKRGETFYAPDVRVPLYPPVLGEGAASLLPDATRPAVVWQFDLDANGVLTKTHCTRAQVRSHRRLDYEAVQHAVDNDEADEQLSLLRVIGELRQAQAAQRDAVDLPTPQQLVRHEPGSPPTLEFRAQLPAEGWNEQISLLAGMAAADVMMSARVGFLRTLPPPSREAVDSIRQSALALGIDWPEDRTWAQVITSLDPFNGSHAALLTVATKLLRGAGYVAFDGSEPISAWHSGVAAPYAHCTAPLRRLADKYVNEICIALLGGSPVPEWARAGLPALVDVMSAADRKAHALERAVVDLAESVVLEPLVGKVFDATVVGLDEKGTGSIQLAEPAVRAHASGEGMEVGRPVRVKLVAVDVSARTVEFRTLT